MSTAPEINLGTYNVGSTDRLRVTIKKGGVAWDLSNGSVTFIFEKPNRSTQFTRTALAEEADSGIFYYDTLTTDLDTAGWWTLSVRVVDNTLGIDKRYPGEIVFLVKDNP